MCPSGLCRVESYRVEEKGSQGDPKSCEAPGASLNTTLVLCEGCHLHNLRLQNDTVEVHGLEAMVFLGIPRVSVA